MYTVSYNGQTVLGESSLGLLTSIGDLTQDLTLTGVEESRVEKQYTLRTAKTSLVDYAANELTAAFEGKEGRILKVTFRVSDSDVAFRYALSVKHPDRDPDLQRTLVYGEASSFNFPDGTSTFICPMAEPGSRWAHARPSYEEVYRMCRRRSVTATPSPACSTWATPGHWSVKPAWTAVTVVRI